MTVNHNDHYHRFLLRKVPPRCRRALDVGCGSGTFARLLARRAEAVDAIDRSAEMIAAARARNTDRITYRVADVQEIELTPGGYDYISCIAAIHHMPFAPTIGRLRAALAPGGVLAVLGLSRPTWTDLAVASVGFVPDQVRKLAGRRRGVPAEPPPPIMDPDLTLAEIRAQARDLLPGAVIRRHVYWRYSMVYRLSA
ncbi:class I SAM-dependent methyltransferase [Actinophytocola sp.]|uniref:class I SAM-dependent methyltransferase n=1 Tax=Actinophytocola sp. TaxID=1872138 RepID=UPI002D80F51C|nr:class I SAM-dependent methyltransferase [Actinophytocola sp.]HET9142685.1 class I SAM-dependent methyltransferase [Actinophytocola sp.]HEU5109765.1 class I SAM-dependent methyltransferase [Micromonosporaceae bacterium]